MASPGTSTRYQRTGHRRDVLGLAFDNALGEADLRRDPDTGALLQGPDLETAVLVSLFTDQRADADELPSGVSRGGWWGEAYPQQDGDEEGSRLWALLVTGKFDGDAPRRAEERAARALAWLLEDGVASDVTVTAQRLRTGVLGIHVAILTSAERRVELDLEVAA